MLFDNSPVMDGKVLRRLSVWYFEGLGVVWVVPGLLDGSFNILDLKVDHLALFLERFVSMGLVAFNDVSLSRTVSVDFRGDLDSLKPSVRRSVVLPSSSLAFAWASFRLRYILAKIEGSIGHLYFRHFSLSNSFSLFSSFC